MTPRLPAISYLVLWLLCLVSVAPGGSVPAAAQVPVAGSASSGPFAPHPTLPPAVVPRVVVPAPAATTAQAAALQSQNTALSSQNAALTTQNAALAAQAQAAQALAQAAQAQGKAAQAQTLAAQAQAAALSQQVAALTPTVQGQPYANPHTDDTHLVLSHYNVAGASSGSEDDGQGRFGTVAGYTKDILDQAACGVDGEVLDTGSVTDYGYTQSITNNLLAADAYDAGPGKTSNGQGVTKFREALCPDFSGIGEDSASLTTLKNFFVQCAQHPSYFTFQGHPVLFCYTGDGGGASVVASVYKPFLASCNAALAAAGKPSVVFLPGWQGASGSSGLQEIEAAGAGGGWFFASGSSPLALDSPIPGMEAYDLAMNGQVAATGKPLIKMYAGYFSSRWNPSGIGGHYYNEYGGGSGQAAQWASILSTVKPDLVQIETYNDAGEGGATSNNVYRDYLTPPTFVPHDEVPDFYQTTAGFEDELAYYIRWYKTGQQPILAKNHLVFYGRTQLASASAAPTADISGLGYVDNPAGDPAGLEDKVYVTVEATQACQVRVSGVSAAPTVLFAPAGISHLAAPVTQAGTPLAEMLVGGQVVQQVTGHAIAAAAALCNLNVASYASAPGIRFSLSGTTTLPVDSAGILIRGTGGSSPLAVSNLVATDLTTSPPTIIAQNDLHGVPGQNVGTYTPATGNALSIGKNNAPSYAVFAVDPTGPGLPTVVVPGFPNNDNCYYTVSKQTTSTHWKVVCQVKRVTNASSGEAGPALVCSNGGPAGNDYFGAEAAATIQVDGVNTTFTLSNITPITGDVRTSTVRLPVNSLALGESYTVTVEDNAGALTATAVPSNQQI